MNPGSYLKKLVTSPAQTLVRKMFGTVTHVATRKNIAALTFDDGPHPVFTPKLLNLLDKHNASATFFVVGQAAQKFKKILHDTSIRGHAIGVHSWDHSPFLSLSGRGRRFQILACQRAIRPYGKRLFRPPWGEQSVLSHLGALLLGYQVVTWNVVAEDWLDIEPKNMADKLIKTIKPGSIVLLHDAIHRSIFGEPQYDRQPMLEALDMFLTYLDGKIRFVTVPELMKEGRPHRENWYRRLPGNS